VFLFYCLLSALKGELRSPDFSHEYPATLHINIKDGFRDQGIGSKLIRAYLDLLKKDGIAGVHFATMSEKACLFFKSLGFKELFRGKRSYFAYIAHRDTPVYILGSKL
jgi:ribosomal protein S18 acetylase RimI-like enzyme